MTDQMIKLREMLDAEKITWHDASEPRTDIFAIDRTHFTYRGYDWSVIHGYGTYGGVSMWGRKEDEGLLEMMTNATNGGEPIGFLTAEEVMEYVRGENHE